MEAQEWLDADPRRLSRIMWAAIALACALAGLVLRLPALTAQPDPLQERQGPRLPVPASIAASDMTE